MPRTILFDTDGSLTPAQALDRLTTPGAAEETRVFSHGYIPDTLWARIVLQVAPDAAGLWYLSLELPNFDRLQVFRVPEDGVPVPFVELGDHATPVTDIRTRYHIAPMEIAEGRTVLLVRGRTSSTVTLDLKLRRLDQLLEAEQDYFAVQAFYLGIAAVFALSALGLFAYTRQAIYLVYLFNLIAHSGVWLLINGTGPGHLWPEFAKTYSVDPHFFVAMTIVGTAAFAAIFLSTARIPQTVRLMIWVVAATGLALMALCALVPEDQRYWANSLVSTIVLPGAGILFMLTAVGLFRGEPAARPLMLTWTGLGAAVALATMRDLGVIPSNALTLTGAQLGSVFEMIVFAYMLLQRLGRVQSEKEDIQREALAAAREQEKVLERRVTERTSELDAAIERERDARRLQQQFVAMVSHEFRNPLAIIDSAAQNLTTREPEDSGRLDKIRASVRRLRRMIDTCLIDERIEGGAMLLQAERLEICELVEDAAEMLKTANQDRPFDLDLPETPVILTADPRLLEVAISNVLDNAVKYAPSGTPINVSVTSDENSAEITVTDQGPGIVASERERIFERYYRSEENARGTRGAGLGLHLVRSIVTAHGGTVRCDGGSSGGTRFLIRLPLTSSMTDLSA
ncbi:sensor histidine kinase [Nisaea sediminum]|uniref:sensor histidine kinase n=1 Tax=Nisaea sediminum TaxID=2775867 RepID=UPI001869386B|nr:sensor histidine kinase [Nisaea sediminum]